MIRSIVRHVNVVSNLVRDKRIGLVPMYLRKLLRRPLSVREIFLLTYATGEWSTSGESASGEGSTLAYTHQFRLQLESYLEENEINSLLDAPCGDMNWMRRVKLHDQFRYVGGDIVIELVEQLRSTKELKGYEFMEMDITRTPMPAVDVWLCRDCLFHLSYGDIWLALENFVRSGIPVAMLSCHDAGEKNSDIKTGGFRLLDLRLAPFGLPEPAIKFEDWIPPFPRRFVGVWSFEEVRAALEMREAGEPHPTSLADQEMKHPREGTVSLDSGRIG